MLLHDYVLFCYKYFNGERCKHNYIIIHFDQRSTGFEFDYPKHFKRYVQGLS